MDFRLTTQVCKVQYNPHTHTNAVLTGFLLSCALAACRLLQETLQGTEPGTYGALLKREILVACIHLLNIDTYNRLTIEAILFTQCSYGLRQDTVMNPLLMKMEQHHGARHEEEFGSAPWIEIAGDHSSHNSPLQEYNGFAFMSNTHVPLEPLYNRPPMHPSYSTAQPLQPLVMPQWPSQLTNPSVDNGVSPGFPPPRPLALIAPMPIKPPLSRSTSTPAPVLAPPTTRKTLTDQDRRRMCQYHEDHPTVKHTEIGGKIRHHPYVV